MMVLPAPASSASRNRSGDRPSIPLADRDPLVRQRIDQRDLRCESRVEQVAVREPRFPSAHGGHHGRPGGEVERRRCGRVSGWHRCFSPRESATLTEMISRLRRRFDSL